jgi:signal transduction histidine kinase
MEWVRAAWRRCQRSPARNVVFTGIITAITVWGSYGEGHPHSQSDVIQFQGAPIPHPSVAAYLLVAIASLALIARNRFPLTVLAVSTAGVFAYTLLGYVNGAALIAPAVAVYAVATNLPVKQALAAAAVALAVLWPATAASNPFDNATGGAVIVIPVLFAATCLGGIAVSNRRAFVASIQARADDEARRRIDEERLRIARELHDVVAHTMSTINVQASAAATVLKDRPDAAAEALQAIRTASKNGLRELRAILNVLRQADDADPTAPAPGLAQLDALIAGASQAGLPTTLAVTGKQVPLPAEVDLAAYRIIQESLTNAIRHAGPAKAAVTLAYDGGRLLIEVSDTGRGAPSPAAKDVSGDQPHTGHGLVGMRERAATVGGTLRAGPASAGGFSVNAALPFGHAEGTDPQARSTDNGAAATSAPGETASSPAAPGAEATGRQS